MKIETQPLEDHQVKLTVEFDAEPVEQAKHRAARKLAKRTKIPGFRPGKAPYNVIQRYIGEEAILEEGLEILINDLYPKIIEEAGIDPYGPGKFDNLAGLDPLTLEFTVPLKAEVELGDYRSIRVPYEKPEVDEDQVQQVLEDLRQRQAIDEPAERPAQEGDRVYIHLSGERAEPKEGENPQLISERSHTVIIPAEGEVEETEWPYPGFARELIGMAAGEEKELEHTFSEDSVFESLQGVPARFRVSMEEVKTHTLPELTDEFAQTVGEYENMEALITDIRESLETQAIDEYHQDYDEEVIKQAVENSEVRYPPQMLENEIDEVVHQLEHRLESQNLDLETYLKTRQIDEAALHEELTPVAESRLARSLVLLEIGEKEGIEVDPDALQEETTKALNVISGYMSEADRKKVNPQDLVANLAGNIYAEMRIEKTKERLREFARGEYVPAEETEPAEETAPAKEEAAAEENAPAESEASTSQEGGTSGPAGEIAGTQPHGEAAPMEEMEEQAAESSNQPEAGESAQTSSPEENFAEEGESEE